MSILERQVLWMHTTLKADSKNWIAASLYLCAHVRYDCNNSSRAHKLLKDTALMIVTTPGIVVPYHYYYRVIDLAT